ncbi:3-carboxy-cis,cis-muconate cycloisomerase [Nocardia acidivorans]|uniref:3-carboxy-cis,cis-muconate cycloisomerase n=1 Tax=Nocardia acidivorans TaxID=404580 RepID=UPI00082DB5CB|nr:3-carboxy-cis,cis-muconate cycloisomerase [Nocardia acidivorans]
MSDGLFDGVLAAGPVAEAVGDRAWVQGMLDFEAALACASGTAGVIPRRAADAIVSRCDAALYDVAELGREAVAIGNPAGPLVRALTARVAPEAAGYVHLGATSQDALDSAAMLVTARALDLLIVDLTVCAQRLAQLAETHAGTLQVGRSLLQQGPPVTFGLTAAGWLGGVAAALDRLSEVRAHRLAAQFGGAVGTLAGLGDKGIEVRADLARRLGLADPAMPWHTERGRITEIAGALGQTCGAIGKIARDIALLAQTEVAEVGEQGPPGTGGSSTMPHKRNPVAAVLAAGSAAAGPGLVSTLLTAAVQEQQRAVGAWHAEWRPYTELLRTTGSAVHWLRTSLDRLRIDTVRMRANLDRTGPVLLAENVAIALVDASDGAVGRQRAADAIAAHAAPGADADFIERLASDPLINPFLDRDRIAALLDPARYLGSARQFVDRALSEWKDRARVAVSVNYVLDGPEDGEPVVLSGSIGSDLRMWEPQAAALAAAGYRVLRYDHRGHGDSPVPPGPYRMADLGADALALLGRLGIEDAHWVGLSLGGMVGAWLGEYAPQRIRSLTLCCTSVELPAAAWSERAAAVRAAGAAVIAEVSVARWFTLEWRAAHPERVRYFADMIAGQAAEGYASCCEAIQTMDIAGDLGRITAPTLVISGADDPATPPEHGHRIATAIPRARHEIVGPGAHLANVESPQRVSELILAHLKENS